MWKSMGENTIYLSYHGHHSMNSMKPLGVEGVMFDVSGDWLLLLLL